MADPLCLRCSIDLAHLPGALEHCLRACEPLLTTKQLPETSSANILARRAARLRALTGNDKLKSESEIQQANMTGREIVQMTMIRPFTLNLEPMILGESSCAAH